MKSDEFSFSGGAVIAIFFYIRFIYGSWDVIILALAITLILIGLLLNYKELKKKNDN